MINCNCAEKMESQNRLYRQAAEQERFSGVHSRKFSLTGLKQLLEKLGDFADAYRHRPEPVLFSGGPTLLISNRK